MTDPAVVDVMLVIFFSTNSMRCAVVSGDILLASRAFPKE